jgi:HEAT repeat protein
VVPVLRGALTDVDSRVRSAALGSLGEMGPAAHPAVSEIARELKDVAWSQRGTAARALGNVGPEARVAIPSIREALRDEELAVRVEAAVALWKVGGEVEGPLRVLLGALDSISSTERVLEALGDMGPKARAAVPALLRLIREGRHEAERMRAARALKSIAPEGVAAER